MSDILMPALSPTMEEGALARWLVKVGDTITPGQIIAEIETDKATMEVEAVDEGVISAILVAEGSQGVLVNTAIARLSGGGAAPASAPVAAAPEPVAPPPSPAPAKSKVAEVRHSETKAAARPTEPKQASHAAPKPAVAESQTTSDPSVQPPRDSLVGGAQPILSANSFESRFSATK